MNISTKPLINLIAIFSLATAMVVLPVFALFVPLATAHADGTEYDYGSVGGYEDDSYDSGSVGGYDSDSYDYGSTGGYSADTYDYGSVGGYSPDTYDYGSTGGYTPDTYDYGSVGGYSPDTYDYGYTGGDETGTYDAPTYESSYDSGESYTAPVSYAGYTSGATYVAPTYTYASYQPTYTYTPPTYVPPTTVINNPPVVQNTLQATCYAPNTNAYVNQNVNWVVNASGGNGGYTYTWGGINVNGQNGSSVTTSYNTPGNETATVSVFSNGQTINVNCGSIYINPIQTQTNNIVASCYANVASAVVGSAVTWTAVVNGGNGNYTYNWTDNNGVNTQNGNGPTFTTTYPIAGEKSPTLQVSSLGTYGYGYNGNGSVTVTCRPIGINSGYNAGYTYTYPTNTGSLASLSSVSLNQVPYTGLADSAGFWEFMVGLVLASLAGTWYFMKVYARSKRRYMINLFKKNNLAQKLVA